MKIFTTTLAAGLLFVSGAFFSSAYANDYYCPFDYEGDYVYAYYDEVVNGNIIVKEGADCTLTGTMVYGKVQVSPGSSLTAIDVYVKGNIEAYMAKFVRLSSSAEDCMEGEGCMTNTVLGNIEIRFSPEYEEPMPDMSDEETTPEDWQSHVGHTMVYGNIDLNENWNPIDVSESYVTGNVQAVKNWGDVRVNMNTLEGNVYAKENYGYVEIVSNYHVGNNIQASDNYGPLLVLDNEVKGNIQVQKNQEYIDLMDNYVVGDVQVFDNYDDEAAYDENGGMLGHGVLIQDNYIFGNLQCKGNYPMPEGSGNMVEGNIEDQCEGFDYSESADGMPDTSGATGTVSTTSSGSSPSTGTTAANSAGGGATGPLAWLLMCFAAALRLRRQRRLTA